MATSDNIHVRCTVNPRLGREWMYPMDKAVESKEVVIVGGGPAGLAAATTASLRGHNVTLYEKQEQLGGQLILAASPPHKDELRGLNEYMDIQARKAGVQVRLGDEVTAEKLSKLSADVVILATGSKQIQPRIPGIESPNVEYAWDVLSGDTEVEETVVIVGGGMVGLETAEYLAIRGKKVKVIEMQSEAGKDMEPFSKIFLLERFQEMNVEVITDCFVNRISEGVVEAINITWRRCLFPADTVVIAVGAFANKNLEATLSDLDAEVYTIGDCAEPSRILEAIRDGTRIAHSI